MRNHRYASNVDILLMTPCVPESLATTCPGEAPPGYTYINGKYYRYEMGTKVRYLPAANTCKLEGARIATMKTPQEYSDIWLPIYSGDICKSVITLYCVSKGCLQTQIQSHEERAGQNSAS